MREKDVEFLKGLLGIILAFGIVVPITMLLLGGIIEFGQRLFE